MIAFILLLYCRLDATLKLEIDPNFVPKKFCHFGRPGDNILTQQRCGTCELLQRETKPHTMVTVARTIGYMRQIDKSVGGGGGTHAEKS